MKKFFPNVPLKIIKFCSTVTFEKCWDTNGKTKKWNIKRDGYNIPKTFFEEADIIITHYSKMVTLYNYFNVKEQLSLPNNSDSKWLSSVDQDGLWYSKENGPDLLKYKFRHIIIDEAHNIRNHRTKKSMTVHCFRSDYYWALTATPAYHKDIGIWSILKFIKFKKIPSYNLMKTMLNQVDIHKPNNKFTSWFIRLIKSNVRKYDPVQQITNRISITKNLEQTKGIKRSREHSESKKFSENLINHERSNKKHKTRSTNIIEWSKEYESKSRTNNTQTSVSTRLYIRNQWIEEFMFSYEREMYEKCKKDFIEQTNIGKDFLKDQQNKENIDSSKSNKKVRNDMMSILQSFNRMRHVADDASQFVNNNNNRNNKVESKISTKLHYLLKYIKNPMMFNFKEDKAVVFCERIATSLNIQKMFENNNIQCVCLNGKIIPSERCKLVSEFTKNKAIKALVTTFCSESSLNLQIANHVLFVSRWWVNSKMDQCIGRCNRMGQTKDVHVTFLSMDLPIERHIKKISETSGALCNQTIKEFCTHINK
jgi:transcription termination factor 2